MIVFSILAFLAVTFLCLLSIFEVFHDNLDDLVVEEYDENVKFIVSHLNPLTAFLWKHTTTNLTDQGCDKDGKFTIFAHGWRGAGDDWIPVLNENFLKYRGGCVIYMDWGFYAKDDNYVTVCSIHWPKVAELLKNKLDQMAAEGILPENIHMYGHSLGARLVLDAGMRFGKKRIGSIDACDAAGPGFYLYDSDKINNAKNAAKNVQCIHTSLDCGTSVRNCHQNWIMGKCGRSQPGADDALFMCQEMDLCPHNDTTEADIAHILCNDFYNSAFEHDFVADNPYNCSKTVDIKTLPPGFKMGYMEKRKSAVRGIIPAPTSKKFPYNVVKR